MNAVALDLLSWPALRDAERRTAAAEAARIEAQRRYHIAPHGQRQSRLKALQDASQEVLRASIDLATLRREAAR